MTGTLFKIFWHSGTLIKKILQYFIFLNFSSFLTPLLQLVLLWIQQKQKKFIPKYIIQKVLVFLSKNKQKNVFGLLCFSIEWVAMNRTTLVLLKCDGKKWQKLKIPYFEVICFKISWYSEECLPKKPVLFHFVVFFILLNTLFSLRLF